MEEIIVKEIRPLNTKVLLTEDKYVDAAYFGGGSSIIDATSTKQGIKEIQKVISVGNMVREVKPGDIVCIEPSRYAIRKYSKNDTKEALEEYTNGIVGYAFPEIEIDEKNYLYLDERDISFVVTKYASANN